MRWMAVKYSNQAPLTPETNTKYSAQRGKIISRLTFLVIAKLAVYC